MDIFITLDYELFFGLESGNVDDCIITPTNELLKIVDPYNIKIVFFIDVGYLVKLNEFKPKFPKLNEDYNLIMNQIKFLSKKGHGLELHIHPHWENSSYNGKKWEFDISKYKLSDFSKKEAHEIILKYSSFLKNITGKTPIAYRAGGWSAQPFSHIKDALKEANIRIDSSVFAKGYHVSRNQFYDFRNVSQYNTKYSFSDVITTVDNNGCFTEFPISSFRLSPFFFWRFAFEKFKKSKKHISYGKGKALGKPKMEIIRLITSYSNSVVSIDGYKASFIQKAFLKYVKNTDNKGHFVIIGHPKAFTPYSLSKTKEFIDQNFKNNKFRIFELSAID